MHGSAKATVQLTVYSKPGPAEDRLVVRYSYGVNNRIRASPFQVSQVTATSCKLNWQKTKDDGGGRLSPSAIKRTHVISQIQKHVVIFSELTDCLVSPAR